MRSSPFPRLYESTETRYWRHPRKRVARHKEKKRQKNRLPTIHLRCRRTKVARALCVLCSIYKIYTCDPKPHIISSYVLYLPDPIYTLPPRVPPKQQSAEAIVSPLLQTWYVLIMLCCVFLESPRAHCEKTCMYILYFPIRLQSRSPTG